MDGPGFFRISNSFVQKINEAKLLIEEKVNKESLSM